jgi:uncharacterized protein
VDEATGSNDDSRAFSPVPRYPSRPGSRYDPPLADPPGSQKDQRPVHTEFVPHPLVRGGHAQTLYAYLFPGRQFPYRATRHDVELRDDDTIVLHDDRPDDWRPGDPVAMVMHGLVGCHQSPYVNRTAGKLNAAGLRTFRMDHRGCGAGVGLARRPYHAGRSGDLRDAVRYVARECPESPIHLVGFSLSGNIALKYLGERPDEVDPQVASAVAICPSSDLPESQVELRKRLTGLYDRYFTKMLLRSLVQYEGHASSPAQFGGRRPRTLLEFDEAVTAPLWGFEGAGAYYEQVSAVQWLDRIRVPTFLLTADDDPIVPARSFASAAPSPAVTLVLTRSGGHLGFIAKRGNGDPDNRWMEWRIVDWIAEHARAAGPRPDLVVPHSLVPKLQLGTAPPRSSSFESSGRPS